jgi:tryptophanyl-tRNA synthetase
MSLFKKKEIILSGIKPTGRLHMGNYFGAMRQLVESEATYAMIADYHSLNFIQDKEEMKRLAVDTIIDYLAVGLDPKKTIIFKQSGVSAHTELFWILNTLVTVPYLMRAHAYKDAEAKGVEVSAGTFNYPVLMASDILLYNTDIVPVGADQKQHVEYARDIAGKFNNRFGETFKLPKDFIVPDVGVVPGTDGRKMSKSYGNTIPLFAENEEIEKAVMSIVTDSGEGEGKPKNVYAIHALFRDKADLDVLYEEKKGKYKELKEALIIDIKKFIAPLREKRKKIASDPAYVQKVIKEGGERARAVADKKLLEVKENIGVL